MTDYDISYHGTTGEIKNVKNRKYGYVKYRAVHRDADAGYQPGS
jgi:hypothetical protein